MILISDRFLLNYEKPVFIVLRCLLEKIALNSDTKQSCSALGLGVYK